MIQPSRVISEMTDIEEELKEMKKKIELYNKKDVMIGVTGATNGDRGNAFLMAIHEYGTKDGRIPERRPIRLTMENNQEKYARRLQQGIDKVLVDEIDIMTALNSIGEEVAGDVKITIMNGLTPPLADSTVRARKDNSDTPLYDTGEMVNSITYEVRDK